MHNDSVIVLSDREKIADPFTELLRSGAQKLTQQAIESKLLILLKVTRVSYAMVIYPNKLALAVEGAC